MKVRRGVKYRRGMKEQSRKGKSRKVDGDFTRQNTWLLRPFSRLLSSFLVLINKISIGVYTASYFSREALIEEA